MRPQPRAAVTPQACQADLISNLLPRQTQSFVDRRGKCSKQARTQCRTILCCNATEARYRAIARRPSRHPFRGIRTSGPFGCRGIRAARRRRLPPELGLHCGIVQFGHSNCLSLTPRDASSRDNHDLVRPPVMPKSSSLMSASEPWPRNAIPSVLPTISENPRCRTAASSIAADRARLNARLRPEQANAVQCKLRRQSYFAVIGSVTR